MADNQAALDERLFSNLGRILLEIEQNPHIRLRDLGDQLGLTERACWGIVAELKALDYISVEKVGRNNVYEVKRTLRNGLDSLAS